MELDYLDWLLCEGGGEPYLEGGGEDAGDECPNGCFDCDFCDEVVAIHVIDPHFLMEENLQVCDLCAINHKTEIEEEISQHKKDAENYAKLYDRIEDINGKR